MRLNFPLQLSPVKSCRVGQAWRFRNRACTRWNFRACKNCHRNAVLHVSRTVPQSALRIQERYMVFGLCSVRTLCPSTRFRSPRHGWASPEDPARKFPASSGWIQQGYARSCSIMPECVSKFQTECGQHPATRIHAEENGELLDEPAWGCRCSRCCWRWRAGLGSEAAFEASRAFRCRYPASAAATTSTVSH